MENASVIGDLDEIVLNILVYLGVGDLLRTSVVCKRWHRIAQDNNLWRNLVLQRWPSQRPVLRHVSSQALHWQQLYKNLTDKGRYSPDDMKYFVVSKVSEPVLDSCVELRQSVVKYVSDVTSQWEKPALYELEETSPRFFNGNMELYYDTHDLKWVFVDRRREYVDDSFTIRLNLDRMSSRQMRFIRPYQVMASCLMMYRWLALFKHIFTEDIGLTFYRIWRFRLKHIKTGLIFETYDWKAAMSSTFSHGCPTSKDFRDAGLVVLDMLSSPFFIMHPFGANTYKICYELGAPQPQEVDSDYSLNSSSNSSCEDFDNTKVSLDIKPGREAVKSPKPGSSNVSIELPASEVSIELPPGEVSGSDSFNNRQQVPTIDRNHGSPTPIRFDATATNTLTASKLSMHSLKVYSETCKYSKKSVSKSSSSDTLNSSKSSVDETDSDNGDEYGYYCNCDSFIHRSSWEYEEQQMIQAETATKWEIIQLDPTPSFELVFDSSEEKWLFCAQSKLEQPVNRKFVNASLGLTDIASTSSECYTRGVSALGLEAMPTSLALYRLICLFDLNSMHYRRLEEQSVWSISLHHRLTRGIIQLKDMNGWLRVSVSFNEELKLYCNDFALMTLNDTVSCFMDNNKPCSNSEMGQKADQTATPCTGKDAGYTTPDQRSTSSQNEDSEEDVVNPLERFKNDVWSLLYLLIDQKFAHPYGTVAGAVA